MKAEAEHYLIEIVDPTIDDFEANPTSVRRAFLACVTTFHTIDYLFENTANPRKTFRVESPEFAVVDRVAHAFKHRKTGDTRNLNNQPLKADEVISRPPAKWDEAVWDSSRWDDNIGGATIEKECELDLLRIVKKAVEFLRSKAAE